MGTRRRDANRIAVWRVEVNERKTGGHGGAALQSFPNLKCLPFETTQLSARPRRALRLCGDIYVPTMHLQINEGSI